MLRIKLFGLFIAFALLALVRPRKCMELLEAADAGAKAAHDKDLIARQNALVQRAPSDERDAARYRWIRDNSKRRFDFAFMTPSNDPADVNETCRHTSTWDGPDNDIFDAMIDTAILGQECPLPPAGWRCTRRAGHDGPCVAVAK